MKLNRLQNEESGLSLKGGKWNYILYTQTVNIVAIQHLSNGSIYRTNWIYLI